MSNTVNGYFYVLDETDISTTTSTSTSGTTQSNQTWVQVSVSTPGPSTGWFTSDEGRGDARWGARTPDGPECKKGTPQPNFVLFIMKFISIFLLTCLYIEHFSHIVNQTPDGWPQASNSLEECVYIPLPTSLR